jgi:membrane protease YdiL (CAAX protease family)
MAAPTDRRWLIPLGGLLLALGLPEVNLAARIVPDESITLVREAEWWVIGGLVVAYILLIERQPLSSIGIRRPTAATFGYAAVATVLLLATLFLSLNIIFPLFGLEFNQAAMGQIVQQPIWFLILISARAAIVEEVIYRGYIIERVEKFTGSKWLAFIISVAAFTLGHLAYWGLGHLIIVGLAAVVLALFYLWRRDLMCNMLAHFIMDVLGLLSAAADQQ